MFNSRRRCVSIDNNTISLASYPDINIPDPDILAVSRNGNCPANGFIPDSVALFPDVFFSGFTSEAPRERSELSQSRYLGPCLAVPADGQPSGEDAITCMPDAFQYLSLIHI